MYTSGLPIGVASSAGELYLELPEFKLLLQRLRLGELFTPSAGVFQFEEFSCVRPSCPIWICDYARQYCRILNLELGKDEDIPSAQTYFFGSRTFLPCELSTTLLRE